jgi:hypothetical protein
MSIRLVDLYKHPPTYIIHLFFLHLINYQFTVRPPAHVSLYMPAQPLYPFTYILIHSRDQC